MGDSKKTLIGDNSFRVTQDRIIETFDLDGNSKFKIDNNGHITPNPCGVTTGVRITSADSPYIMISTLISVFCDTDGGAIALTLPEGIANKKVRIINCGSSGNDVTVTPYGSELLTGANDSRTLSDKSIINLEYDTTEGWW